MGIFYLQEYKITCDEGKDRRHSFFYLEVDVVWKVGTVLPALSANHLHIASGNPRTPTNSSPRKRSDRPVLASEHIAHHPSPKYWDSVCARCVLKGGSAIGPAIFRLRRSRSLRDKENLNADCAIRARGQPVPFASSFDNTSVADGGGPYYLRS